MTQGTGCALHQSATLAEPAWLGHSLSDIVGEADAYLLLDQYPASRPWKVHADRQLMMPNLIVGRDGEADNGEGSGCGIGSQSGSPAAQQARKLQGGGTTRSRNPSRTTSLAQREAHKRYREKKKQSIAAMEAAVQAKRSQLKQLQAENDQLRSKARVLETAERCSVEIHELMKLLDGLQGLAEDDVMDGSGANRAGSSCSDASDTAAAVAGGRRSSTDHSSQEALPDIPACPFNAAPAQQQSTAPAQQQQQGSSFLQTLLTPVQQQLATAAVPIKQEPGQHSSAALLSLQNEQHWLAMAERYLQAGPQPEQTSLAAAAVAGACCAAPAAPASSGAAAGEDLCAAAGRSSSGVVSPNETAESLGSSVLSELGSVDTAEQGLVIYKAFLQKASEMLALAQQQQQQSQADAAASTQQELGELTRSTIGRLQPFLVARGQGVVYDWNARNLETQQPEEPPAGMWPSVLDALLLDADTQRDALQCFELFGIPLTRLLEERLQLTQRYHQLMHPAAAPGRRSDSSSSGAKDGGSAIVVHVTSAKTLEAVAGTLISSAAVLRALAANLERYQSLDGVFAHSLTNLLSGAQIAAACVASYPFLPRWHSMMAALKRRKETESQQEQLQSMRDAQQGQPQRRSSRARVATKAAKEAYA